MPKIYSQEFKDSALELLEASFFDHVPMAILSARLRFPLTLLGVLLLVVDVVWCLLIRADRVLVGPPTTAIVFAVIACLLLGVLMVTFGSAHRGEAVAIAAPVTGTWQAINSPGSMVPSHGTHGLGQAYALDIFYDPDRQWGLSDRDPGQHGFAPPQSFASFGRSILAPAPVLSWTQPPGSVTTRQGPPEEPWRTSTSRVSSDS